MEQHKHTGIDGSFKLEARDSLENCPQTSDLIAKALGNQKVLNPAIQLISGTAGSTYTSVEQKLINTQTTTINNLIIVLRNVGISL